MSGAGVTNYVIFTVFSQMSVGALIAMVIADFLAKGKEDAKFFETGAWVSVPVAVIGLIGILSHEARPVLAMMTMTKNVGTSTLSNEVLALTIFVILAVVYTAMWVLEPEYGSLKWFPVFPGIVGKLMALRKPVGALGAIVGIAYLFVGAKAYMLPAMPALNIATTPVFFVVTAFLAGVTAVAAVLSLKYMMKKEGDEAFGRMLWIVMGIALVMVIVLAFGLSSNASTLESMARAPPTEFAAAALEETLAGMESEPYATYLMARWALSVGLALILTLALAFPLKTKNMTMASALVIVLFIVVFIGELLGRTVFFGTNVPLGEVARAGFLTTFDSIGQFYTGIGL